jgi:hypothetical protein
VRDHRTLCAALCTSKGAAEAIHSAVGGLAPVKLHLRFHDLTIEHLKPPADWLARHGRALVGNVTVEDETLHSYTGDSDSDSENDASVILHEADRDFCLHIRAWLVQPRALEIVHCANVELLGAFSLSRLTQLVLSLEEPCDGYGVRNVAQVMAALAPLTGLQYLSVSSPERWSGCEAALAPLTRLTRLWLISDVMCDGSESMQRMPLPWALLQTLPASLQSLRVRANVEPGATLTHLTALTFLALSPLMPLQLAALPCSVQHLELYDMLSRLSLASLTHLTALTALEVTCLMFQPDFTPPALSLLASLEELRVSTSVEMIAIFLPLLQLATKLTALELGTIDTQHLVQLSAVLAPLTRLAVLQLHSLCTLAGPLEEADLPNDEQTAELGMVLSQLPLRQLSLPTFYAWWDGGYRVWNTALLQHCSPHVRELLSRSSV